MRSLGRNFSILIFLAGLLVPWSGSMAQHGHGHGTGAKMETRTVVVEGVKVIFGIMENEEHRKMLKEMKRKEEVEAGTTHNISVTLREAKTDKEISDATIQMKVIDPKGKDQIKTLKYAAEMKSYDAYFNLKEKGRYQVLLLFRIGEKKGTAGIYYEVK
ncbi:MAG: hypothetical protein N3G78_11120 [Desulfobacterota bacterium]|nr:hypothetical protein [Thermodesulfobacteriota bacterium]